MNCRHKCNPAWIEIGNRDVQLPRRIAPDNDTVLVTFVDVPVAITFDFDEQEALMQAVDALEIGLSF